MVKIKDIFGSKDSNKKAESKEANTPKVNYDKGSNTLTLIPVKRETEIVILFPVPFVNLPVEAINIVLGSLKGNSLITPDEGLTYEAIIIAKPKDTVLISLPGIEGEIIIGLVDNTPEEKTPVHKRLKRTERFR